MATLFVTLREMSCEDLAHLYNASREIEGDYNDLVTQIVKDWLNLRKKYL